jgi:hypothetical protein
MTGTDIPEILRNSFGQKRGIFVLAAEAIAKEYSVMNTDTPFVRRPRLNNVVNYL